MRELAVLALVGALSASPAASQTYGTRVQAIGTGYACSSVSDLKEVETAQKAKDTLWLGAISECVYLKDGTNAVVLDTSGDYTQIRAIMPNGDGAKLWVNKANIKAPCFISSGCK